MSYSVPASAATILSVEEWLAPSPNGEMQVTRHVLDGDGVAAHGFHFFCQADKVRYVMHRAGSIAEGAFGVLASLFYRLDGNAQVAQVIHGIENAEYIDAVVGGFPHEGAHHVIGVMAIAQQILSAQQHLDAAVRQCLSQVFQAFPRIFLEIAYAGIERGAAPGLQRPEANVIESGTNRQHVVRAHAGGNKGLMSVTQN